MPKFEILNRPYQTMTASGAVDMAARIAASFTEHCRGQYAIAAHRAGIDRQAFRRLTQPSRRPKSISVDIWQRLIDAYAAHLRRELVRIRAEIEHCEALGAPARPLEDLLDAADALRDEIQHIIKRRS